MDLEAAMNGVCPDKQDTHRYMLTFHRGVSVEASLIGELQLMSIMRKK